MGRGWGRTAGLRKPIGERIRAADKLFLAGKYGRAEPRFAEVVAELEAIRALDLWMELPGERSASHRAFAMRTFAHVRARAGVELDEALRWVDEAITVQTVLLAANPGQPRQHEIDVSQLVRTMVLDAMTRQRSPADGGTGH